MIDIAKCIREWRAEKGLRQFQLARRAEMSPAQLCQIETGRVSPSFLMVERLAKALDLEVVELIAGVGVQSGAEKVESEPEVAAFGDYIPLRMREQSAKSAYEKIVAAESLRDKLDDERGVASACTIGLNRIRRSCEGVGATLAEELRTDLGLGTAPLGDLASVFKFRGVRIHWVKMAKSVGSVPFWNMRRGTLVIVLNESVTRERELYRLVYDLGTAVLFVSRGNRRLHETHEDHRFLTDFAAAFLMPGVTVRNYVSVTGIGPADWTFESLVAIKRHFGVSAETFALRLEELGLIVPSLRIQLRDRLRAYYKAHPKSMEPQADSKGLHMTGVFK